MPDRQPFGPKRLPDMDLGEDLICDAIHQRIIEIISRIEEETGSTPAPTDLRLCVSLWELQIQFPGDPQHLQRALQKLVDDKSIIRRSKDMYGLPKEWF